MSDPLKTLRDRIDRLDDELLRLVNERADLAHQIGKLKGDGTVYRPEREAQVLRRLKDTNKGPLPGKAVARLFTEIISACRALEDAFKVACLGPKGTFSEEAVMKHFGGQAPAELCSSIDEVFRTVESGAAGYAVVPVENSTEGAVGRALDLLVSTPLKVCGEVLLPIASSEEVVSASRPPRTRPCRDIQIKQVLDDRRIAEGRVRLEITATGTGLVPELRDLVDLDATGLPGPPPADAEGSDESAVQDHGLDIGALDAKGADVQALCTRSWSVDFAADAKTLPAEFTFPPARLAATATYQRYADADVVEVGPVVPLAQGAGRRLRWVIWVLALAVVTGVASLVLWLLWRRRAVPPAPRYQAPRELTPFSLLGLLQRIRDDATLPLSPSARQSLDQTIARLEQGYFTSGAGAVDGADLPKIMADWLRQANGAAEAPVPTAA